MDILTMEPAVGQHFFGHFTPQLMEEVVAVRFFEGGSFVFHRQCFWLIKFTICSSF